MDINLKEKSMQNNVSHKQRQALKRYTAKQNIIIKEADKRSAIIILNKTYSITKIQEILRDKTDYKLIDTNIDNNIISKIRKFCKIHNETLAKKEKFFLTKYIPKTNNFYRLPKIHMSKEIKIALETQKS